MGIHEKRQNHVGTVACQWFEEIEKRIAAIEEKGQPVADEVPIEPGWWDENRIGQMRWSRDTPCRWTDMTVDKQREWLAFADTIQAEAYRQAVDMVKSHASCAIDEHSESLINSIESSVRLLAEKIK